MRLFESAKINPHDYELGVIDKTTKGLENKPWKEILSMLISMLEKLKSPSLQQSKDAYGYSQLQDGSIVWNDNQLRQYIQGPLTQRFTDKNYTFFLLQDSDKKLIAVASGNIDKKQFILINLVVRKDLRGKGYGIALMAHTIQHLYDKSIEKVVICLSPQSQKNNLGFYKKLKARLQLQLKEGSLPTHPTDKSAYPEFSTTNCLLQMAAAKETTHPDRPGGP